MYSQMNISQQKYNSLNNDEGDVDTDDITDDDGPGLTRSSLPLSHFAPRLCLAQVDVTVGPGSAEGGAPTWTGYPCSHTRLGPPAHCAETQTETSPFVKLIIENF